MWFTRVFVCVIIVTIDCCESNDSDVQMTIRYLQKFGYLNDNVHELSTENSTQAYHRAVALFQEYYQLPGNGILNEVTLAQMRLPRCGLEDISERTFGPLAQKWPRTHLTWNFHLASDNVLRATRAAFELWAMNSSLTFERDRLNPNIIISFREGFHTNIKMENDEMCRETFDGKGGILAHAFYPNGDPTFISEIHVDKAETWHVQLNVNPSNTFHLFHTLVHEIGHALGISHSPHKNSVMYAFAPQIPFPVKLSLEDILTIQHLYGAKKSIKFPMITTTTTTIPPSPPTTVRTTMTTIKITTPTTTKNAEKEDNLCALRQIDNVLILNDRIYVARKRRVWSIDLLERTFKKPMLMTDYMKFLPDNFTRLSGAYQTASDDLVLFLDGNIYMVEYPSFTLIASWPRSYTDIGLPADAKINAVVNNNRGQSFVIYNDHLAGEIDDCSMRIARFHNIQTVFPGIPNDVSLAFRFVDGNLYFIRKRQYYRFDDFMKTVTTSGTFDMETLGIVCPTNGLLQQLRDLIERFARITSSYVNDSNDYNDDS